MRAIVAAALVAMAAAPVAGSSSAMRATGALSLVTPLTVGAPQGLKVDAPLSYSFSVQNTSGSGASVQRIEVAVRGPASHPGDAICAGGSGLTLKAGQKWNCSVSIPGGYAWPASYTIWADWLDYGGNWHQGELGPNQTFTLAPVALSLTSFTPTTGGAGAVITLRGSHLSGLSAVTFNGAAATTFSVSSDSQATAAVPSGATSGTIAATTPSGTVTSSARFTVIPAPAVSSFSPTSARPGTNIALTGSHLNGASAVAFNGVKASYRVISDSSITTVVPASATSGTLSVTTPGGTGTSSSSFTVIPPQPTIAAFSPAAGGIGSNVTIAGTHLTSTSSVTFDGRTATFQVKSDSQLSATVPSGASNGPIVVTTGGGTATSSRSFTVIPAPTISSFTPTSGKPGARVTITGSNLGGASVVTFNGVRATFSIRSTSTIIATVPTATTGHLAVTTVGGTGTSDGTFTVIPPTPAISSFSPGQGTIGDTITIRGSGFTWASAVAFNGAAASGFTVVSDSQLTVAVPRNASTGKLTITNPTGTATSLASFTFIPGFTVTAWASSTTVSPGQSVTITGTVSPVTPGAKVSLQSGIGSVWTSVSQTQPNAKGQFGFTVTENASGSVRYRVDAPAAGGHAVGDSAEIDVEVTGGRLTAGSQLIVGGYLTSGDGRYRFTLNSDGNLSLMVADSGRSFWSTGTPGHPDAYLTMQSDGNLVLYSSSGAAYWSTSTGGHPGSFFEVQDDGNLAVYSAGGAGLWSAGSVDQDLQPGEWLQPGESIYSENRAYQLIMQGDGNLVLYRVSGGVMWASGTDGHSGAHAVMQYDGNFVVYPQAGPDLWNSQTEDNSGAHLIVQDDGNAVIYSASGPALWSTQGGLIGGGGGSGGGGGAQAIVNAAQAMENAGYSYCFDGGNTNGPTVGINDRDSDGSYSNCATVGKIGFDCTGLTLYAVYRGTDKVLSHDSHQPYSASGQMIGSASALQPGDVVYFDYNTNNGLSSIDHAGIYVGNGNVLSAASEKYGIVTHSIAWYESGGLHFVGGVRFW